MSDTLQFVDVMRDGLAAIRLVLSGGETETGFTQLTGKTKVKIGFVTPKVLANSSPGFKPWGTCALYRSFTLKALAGKGAVGSFKVK